MRLWHESTIAYNNIYISCASPAGLALFCAPPHILRYGGGSMDWKQAAAQLRTDPDTMQRMAESPDGQALMALMQQQNGSQLQKAMEQGEGASAAEMAALLKTVLSSGEGRALLQRLSQQLK